MEGCPLFDVVRPAFALPTRPSLTPQDALKDGFGETVMVLDMPQPSEHLSIDSCWKRFPLACNQIDLAPGYCCTTEHQAIGQCCAVHLNIKLLGTVVQLNAKELGSFVVHLNIELLCSVFVQMNIKKALEKVIEWQSAAAQLKPHLPPGDAVLTAWYRSLQDFKKDLPVLYKLANDALKVSEVSALVFFLNFFLSTCLPACLTD